MDIRLCRPYFLSLCLGAAALAAGNAAHAQAGTGAAAAASPACVEVEVNGVRSQSFTCLSEKMAPTAASRAQAARAAGAPLASEEIATRPGNAIGVYNAAALSNRMGNTLGTSVYPQRPPASAR